MPGTTTNYAITFSEAADEVKAFPGEVSSPGAKTIDKVLTEKLLKVKGRAASYEATSGELGECTKAITVTLPSAAVANQVIGVVAAPAVATELTGITTSGGAKIYGDFIVGEATIKLAQAQHVVLQSDGTNWKIIAGEPKREQEYKGIKAVTKVEAEAGIEPSATRPGYVVILVSGGGAGTQISVGGVNVVANPPNESVVAVYVPPGQKLKGTTAFYYSSLLL
jgi:hypothetical protein